MKQKLLTCAHFETCQIIIPIITAKTTVRQIARIHFFFRSLVCK